MILWLYMHMSVTRWDVMARNASLGLCATVQWIFFCYSLVRAGLHRYLVNHVGSCVRLLSQAIGWLTDVTVGSCFRRSGLLCRQCPHAIIAAYSLDTPYI
jgi:hypothetical protein